MAGSTFSALLTIVVNYVYTKILVNARLSLSCAKKMFFELFA